MEAKKHNVPVPGQSGGGGGGGGGGALALVRIINFNARNLACAHASYIDIRQDRIN